MHTHGFGGHAQRPCACCHVSRVLAAHGRGCTGSAGQRHAVRGGRRLVPLCRAPTPAGATGGLVYPGRSHATSILFFTSSAVTMRFSSFMSIFSSATSSFWAKRRYMLDVAPVAAPILKPSTRVPACANSGLVGGEEPGTSCWLPSKARTERSVRRAGRVAACAAVTLIICIVCHCIC